MIHQNPRLFLDPNITYPSADRKLDFQDYMAECQALIRATRLDSNSPFFNHIVETNTPFEYQPSSKGTAGALLIHGLYDSPFIMQDIGRHLQSQGLLTRSILLPGHGTVPGALLNVTCEDWIEAVYYGIAQLAKQVDKIYLVGFSLGASLALHHVLSHPKNTIAGLVLLAPAIKIYSPFAFAANWHKCVSWFSPRLKWLHQGFENDYTKYQSYTFNSVSQINRLIQQLNKLQRPLSLPQLCVMPEHDKTVSCKAALAYFKRFASSDSHFILYTQQPQVYEDKRILRRPAMYPQWNIADYSHVAIPTSPDNKHYGQDGDYIDASHILSNKIGPQPVVYDASNNIKNSIFFETGLQTVPHLRLTLNPDFGFLTDRITDLLNA